MRKLDRVFYCGWLALVAITACLIFVVNVGRNVEIILYLAMIAFILIVTIIDAILYTRKAKCLEHEEKGKEKKELSYACIRNFLLVWLLLMFLLRSAPVELPM